MKLVNRALICAILAKAGPDRGRLIFALCNDDRVTTSHAHFSLLDKIARGQLLMPEDVTPFEATLEGQHRQAIGGLSLLERAVCEHNLLAASKVYKNIALADLGRLLRVTAEKAESVAAEMIGAKRLRGKLDQRVELLTFAQDDAQPRTALAAFDARIAALVAETDDALVRVDALGLSSK
jgi:COP9 signalosome complex subunit 4